MQERDIKTKMLEFGADGSLMSGSGPSVFGLYADENKANAAYEYFKATSEYGHSTFLCDFT